MTHQNIAQLFIALGILLTALGQYTSYKFAVLGIILTALAGYISYYIGNIDNVKKDKKIKDTEKEISSLKAMTSKISEQSNLIYQSIVNNNQQWAELEMKYVPPGFAAYLLLLFKSNKGIIYGKVRIKGSTEETSFSTTANNEIPVALRNYWDSEKNHYKIPTIMEFMVTEKTNPDSSLSIFTQGWIDSYGTEPH